MFVVFVKDCPSRKDLGRVEVLEIVTPSFCPRMIDVRTSTEAATES